MKFPDQIKILAAGGTLRAASLFFMDFRDAAKYIWTGFGDLKTNDGFTWKGIGEFITASSVSQQQGTVANNMTVKLSAASDLLTDELIARALQSESQVYGRRFVQAVQYFDDNSQPVGTPTALFVGVMDRMTFNQKNDRREIILNVESPLVRRRSARVQYFSDPDQRRRDASDLAFEFVSTLRDKSVSWPKY